MTCGQVTMANTHIVILVRGTLFEAQQGVLQLKFLGVGAGMVGGIAALFGMGDKLVAFTDEGAQVPLPSLTGRWLLVIPEDAYTVFRAHLSHLTQVDGRVVPKEGEFSPLFNINPD